MHLQTLANGETLQRNSPLFWFALLVPVLIIGFGINFIANPVVASAGFGIPMHDPSAFPAMWIKSICDMFAGIAVGHGFVILSHLGFAPLIFMHWETALYMAIVAVLLHRKSKA